MGLVGAMVRVLAQNDGLDSVKRSVMRPVVPSCKLVKTNSNAYYTHTYQEYTSFIGGYTVFPLASSFFRNRFNSRN